MGTPYPPYPQESPDSPHDRANLGEQRDYLRGASVGFGQAIAGAFKNTFTYRGRASRPAYWWFALFSGIVYIAATALDGTKSPGIVMAAVVYVVLFFVNLALSVRRLHDADRSGFWVLIGLIPLIGAIALLWFYVLPGTEGPNRYG